MKQLSQVSRRDKSFPPSAWGLDDDDFVAGAPRLSEFQTPLLTLDESAMAHNVRTVSTWIAERGLLLAPHGKTTMAPVLWRQLLDAGSWGLTLATAWQAQVARGEGVQRILLASEVVDPVALAWVTSELEDPDFTFACWVDSVQAVEAMRAALSGLTLARPLSVLIELGGNGGRAGARTVNAAIEVARAVEAAPELELAGVAGWEGALAHDRAAASVDGVRLLLDDMIIVADSIDWADRPIISAGGSAFFDLVADALAPLRERADVVLRPGAFQVHDDGFYAATSPLRTLLRSAMHGWSRVLSVPDERTAIIDGGRRDFPHDEGMPTCRAGAVSRINDQHAFLALEDGAEVQVGEVLRLGLSHPCTAFDKWRCIPVVADAMAEDPVVVSLVRTLF
ncbi:MAG: alanine racemase [Pseudolysinimonas sp.]